MAIITRQFHTYQAAQTAASFLFKKGFSKKDVSLFFIESKNKYKKTLFHNNNYYNNSIKKSYIGAIIGIISGIVIGIIIGIALYIFTKSKISSLLIIGTASVGAWIGSLLGVMLLSAYYYINFFKITHNPDILLSVHTNKIKKLLRASQILSNLSTSNLKNTN